MPQKKTKNVLFFHEISQATRAVKINAQYLFTKYVNIMCALCTAMYVIKFWAADVKITFVID